MLRYLTLMIDLNVKGPFRLSSLVGPRMLGIHGNRCDWPGTMTAVGPVSRSSTDLEAALAEACRHGWSTLEGSLDFASRKVAYTRSGVPTRRGEAVIGILEARSPDQAHPKSLSARYGLGPFPLHTDGAHLRRPPKFTLLEATVETEVPTLLFDLRSTERAADVEHALRDGVFAVGHGASSFYAPAVDEDENVRYDPACMFPVDPLARTVHAWLEEVAHSAASHHWTLGTTLVIANRRCLHRRPDVTGNPDRALRRLMIDWDR